MIAQTSPDMLFTEKGGVEITSSFITGSNSLNSNFAKSFYTGGLIDGSTIEDISNRQSEHNRFGAIFNYGINASIPVDTSGDYQISLSLQDNYFLSSSFTSGLFNLAFQGNRAYAGQTIHAGPSSLRSIRYQQLAVGLNIKQRAGFSISYLKGENLQMINVNRMDVTTHPLGYYLVANVKAEQYSSDTSASPGIDNWTGNGFAANIFFKHQFSSNKENFLLLSVSNVGAIWWNNKTMYRSTDTTLTWEGFSLNNLFNPSDSMIFSATPDSVLDELTSSKSATYKMNMPGWFSLRYQLPLNQKNFLMAGMDFLMDKNYSPYAGLKYTRRISSGFRASLQAGTGGFGKFYLGTGAEIKVKKYYAVIDIPGILGLVSQQRSSDLAVHLKIGKTF